MGLTRRHLLSVVHPILWCSPLYFERSLFPAYFAAFYILLLQSVYNYVTVLMLSGHLLYSFWCYWKFRKKLHVFAMYLLSSLGTWVVYQTSLSLHHCVLIVSLLYFVLHFYFTLYDSSSNLLFPSWNSSSFWVFCTLHFHVHSYFGHSLRKCIHAILFICLLIHLPRHLHLNSVLFEWFFFMLKCI